jgi:serine/threonine protein phosphatase 1
MSNYAVSDLHGCWTQWEQIKNFLQEDDRLFILGDCIDRQPGGLAILTEAINDPRCVVLCGNHEDMMADALEEEIQYGYSDYWIWRWFSNGGQATYDEWQEAGRDFGWIGRIRKLPLWAEYTNTNGDKILMSHSGCPPRSKWNMDSLPRKALLWDRDHLKNTRWHRADNEFMVHGHTPIMIMPFYEGKNIEIEPGICIYCDGHKINLDNGSCWTGHVCMLDLDTFDEHIFEVE